MLTGKYCAKKSAAIEKLNQ